MPLRAVLLALLALWPVAAAGHGESGAHGDGRPAAGTGGVAVQGYRVELLTHPGPLAVGEETHLVAKITSDGGPDPVSGGRGLIGLAPPGSPIQPRPAAQATWAGSYEGAVTPARRGPHQARVVVEAIEERHLHAPLVFEFPVAVGAAAGLGVAVWALLALVSGFGAVAVYAIALRAKLARPGESRVNLLEVDWLRR